MGARNELAAALKELDRKSIRDFLLSEDCDWIEFNMDVPAASHMGGIWKRLIRSVRAVLSALLLEMDTQRDDEALRTLMTEAENDINSRPLSMQDLADPESAEPLTPIHLLTLKTDIVLPPPGDFQRPDLYSRKRWRRIQYMTNQFWIRWQREYFTLQYKRQKWNDTCRDTKVGDIVFIRDLPRNHWPLARVTKVYPSKDGLIRKVQLFVTKDGKRSTLERPVHKLIFLLSE